MTNQETRRYEVLTTSHFPPVVAVPSQAALFHFNGGDEGAGFMQIGTITIDAVAVPARCQ